jgi:hypothetical protein
LSSDRHYKKEVLFCPQSVKKIDHRRIPRELPAFFDLYIDNSLKKSRIVPFTYTTAGKMLTDNALGRRRVSSTLRKIPMLPPDRQGI